jgi:formylglycine-generating enzyme required for sulfatase activity
MVGNVWEWVGLWMQAGRTWQTIDFQQAAPWPSTYGSDGTGNVNGTSNNGSVAAAGCPAAARRGGAFFGGEGGSGVFAFNADSGPSYYELGIGFRCCRGR